MYINDINIVDGIIAASAVTDPIGLILILNANEGFECYEAAINNKTYFESLNPNNPIKDDQSYITDDEIKIIHEFINSKRIGGNDGIIDNLQYYYLDYINNNIYKSSIFKEFKKENIRKAMGI